MGFGGAAFLDRPIQIHKQREMGDKCTNARKRIKHYKLALAKGVVQHTDLILARSDPIPQETDATWCSSVPWR